MKNPDTQTKLEHTKNGLRAATRTYGIVFAALILNVGRVCAQAPTISYSGPQTYTPGTAITPLVPTSSGVAAFGYSSSPAVISAGLSSVYGVASNPAGDLYVTDPVSGQVKKIPVGGSPVILASGYVNQIRHITVDTLGNVFFTGGEKVYKLPVGSRGAGGVLSFAFNPWGIGVDNRGYVFVAEHNNDTYVQIAIGGSDVYSGGAGALPTGVAVDAVDNLYIANEGSASISRINVYFGNPAKIGSGFNQPNGIAVDFEGNVFVADQGNNAVKIVPAGSNTPITIGSGFNAPTAVATDGAGNVYVADNGNNALKKISPVGGYFISPTLLPPGLSFDHATGIISGTPTGSFTAKKYTITAYNSFGSTSASVIISVKNSVDLASLTLNPGTLNPSFSPGTNMYSVVVDKSVTVIGVDATPVDATATVMKNGVALKIGLNIVTIVVTSKDRLNSKTYTIYVTRGALSSNAFLSQIQPDAGHLSPYFTPAITSYADTVANNILSIRITPASSFPLATITVNGVAVTSDSLSQAIPLAQGLNTITTVVTAQDGVTTKTYTLTVFRALSNDADLTFMQPTAGFMAPIFTPAIISYDDTVNYTNLAMEITPIAHDSLATITVNGVAVVSGSMSQAIALNEGLNIITTVVTARDGVTTKTFTLTVMRAFSTDAYLTQIQPSAGMLSPVFNPMVTGYTDAVNNTNAAITVTPVVDDPLATLTVNGAALASGSTSPAIPLSVGSNTITTIVTAPDGVTTKTYTLTVTRAAPIPGPLNAAYQPVGVAIVTANPALADDGLLVHQGISPNGDGINDFLVIENITNYPDNKLSIMNRNGQLIFEAKGYDNSSKVFDGHSNKNGQMQLPGTYFYQLEYTVKGILKHKTGFIVLRY